MKKEALLNSFKRPDSPRVAPSSPSLPPIAVAQPERPAAATEVPRSPAVAVPPIKLQTSPPSKVEAVRARGEATIGRYTSYSDDKKALLELRIYLSSQGLKINDSKLVRAIICTIKPSEELARNYRIRESDDRRYTKKR